MDCTLYKNVEIGPLNVGDGGVVVIGPKNCEDGAVFSTTSAGQEIED